MSTGTTGYVQKRISNYEGFRRLEAMQEKVATGKLKPMHRDPVRSHLCEVCKCRKRSVQAVPSLLMGHTLPETKLRGRFVLACDECARSLRRAGVPQQALEVQTRLEALGLVMP